MLLKMSTSKVKIGVIVEISLKVINELDGDLDEVIATSEVC